MIINTVLFDLDQTLLDFMKMKRESCRGALKSMIVAGLKINMSEGLEKLMETYIRVGIESNRAFEEFLREQMGFVDKRILEAGIKGYEETKRYFLKPYPHVIEILNFLKTKNIKLGLVTDAPREKAIERLEAMGIKNFFEVIVTFSETGVKKPDPRPFKLALRLLNSKPNESLFVGDSIEKDIKPAKK
ncbi:MAG: HAD-IA family hydrolase [Candidatus Aenigmatarchaeota archaeon]